MTAEQAWCGAASCLEEKQRLEGEVARLRLQLEQVGGALELSEGEREDQDTAIGTLLGENVELEHERDDLRSRLACVLEATSWDRPYDERIAAIRGMCDLTTNGMTPAQLPEQETGA